MITNALALNNDEAGMQGEAWRQDIALSAAIIRFAQQQLPVLAGFIEEQSMLIVSEFKGLAEKTKEHSHYLSEVIELASKIELEGKIVPYEQSIEVLYQPLAEAIEKILDVSKLSMDMVMNIGNAADNITRMEHSIAQVQDLTKQTNMLAMNTQIEAARSGELGKSFRIIAQEVKELSERIKLVSTDIKKEVSCVAGSVRRSSKLVDNLAHYDMTENLQLRDRVGALIESILAQNKHFSDLLHHAADSSQSTAQGIQNLVMGIQFQDRSSQVTHDLCGLLGIAAERLEGLCRGEKSRLSDTEVSQVTQAIKLSDVKRQFIASLASCGLSGAPAAFIAPVASSGSDDGIELF